MKRKIKVILFILLSIVLIIAFSIGVFYHGIYSNKSHADEAFSKLASLDKASYVTNFNHDGYDISCYKDYDKIVYILKNEECITIDIQYSYLSDSSFYFKEYSNLIEETEKGKVKEKVYYYNYNSLEYTISKYEISLLNSSTISIANIITSNEFIELVCEKEELELKEFDLYEVCQYLFKNSKAYYLFDDKGINANVLGFEIEHTAFLNKNNPLYKDVNFIDFSKILSYTENLPMHFNLAYSDDFSVIYPFFSASFFECCYFKSYNRNFDLKIDLRYPLFVAP